jgi:hypothetical protein
VEHRRQEEEDSSSKQFWGSRQICAGGRQSRGPRAHRLHELSHVFPPKVPQRNPVTTQAASTFAWKQTTMFAAAFHHSSHTSEYVTKMQAVVEPWPAEEALSVFLSPKLLACHFVFVPHAHSSASTEVVDPSKLLDPKEGDEIVFAYKGVSTKGKVVKRQGMRLRAEVTFKPQLRPNQSAHCFDNSSSMCCCA